LVRATDRVRGIFAQPVRTTWIFDVELLARMLATIPAAADPAELIHELPLNEWRDVAGSKVKARDFVRAAGQLAIIWQNYRLPNRAKPPTARTPLPPPRARNATSRKQPADLVAVGERP
jgi:hypothetical protein